MDMNKRWSGVLRRVVEVSKIVAGTAKQIPRFARDDKQTERSDAQVTAMQVPRLAALARDDKPEKQIEATVETARRTVPLPSILTPGAPTLTRAGVLPKPSPANLRRFAEMPIARRAINIVKDRVAGMKWRIEPKKSFRFRVSSFELESQRTHTRKNGLCGAAEITGTHISQKKGYVGHPEGYVGHSERYVGHPVDDIEARIVVLTENFEAPNPDDSFRSMIEQVLEDVLVGGYGAIELDLTGDERRPLVLWPVDGASLRIKANWDGNPASERYVQTTGMFAPSAEITLTDEELSYIRLNPRTHTPFGLGKLEVAFETIHEFLGAHRYAARLASNTVVQYALWLQNMTPQHHERLIRWWQDEIEGTGKVPILSVESKPEVLRFGAGTDQDLRLQWQEFLIRMIADAFDLPPMMLGLERDVNRNTATTMSDDAFRMAVVPVARLLAEHLTRDVISKRLGWNDLQFVFTDVDAPNEMEQVQIQKALIECGVLTVNEVRGMRGLEPLSAGGATDAPALE